MLVTLIGMPAAGKSSLGRQLAPALGYRWLDADALIEARDGRPLQKIIDEDGLEAFKALEEEVLLSVPAGDIVLSTGGSAVYYDRVMRRFAQLGAVVYLRVGLDTLLRRLGDFSARGIALRPGQTIADLYRERTVLYEKYATVTVDCDGDDYDSYLTQTRRALRAIATHHPQQT